MHDSEFVLDNLKVKDNIKLLTCTNTNNCHRNSLFER